MIVNPRLVDYFDLGFTQDDVSFAIPHLTEDIPLYLDPFLLWSSEDPNDRELHNRLLGFFDYFAGLVREDRDIDASRLIATCSEPLELGLGYSQGSKRGSSLGPQLADRLIEVYRETPQLLAGQISHIEEIQLFVPGIAHDRISDLAACVLRDALVEFTVAQAEHHEIPMRSFQSGLVWDSARRVWKQGGKSQLPYNPIDGAPLLFAPLSWLRHLPWINYEDFYASHYAPYVLQGDKTLKKVSKHAVLAYNRAHYGLVQRYVADKERMSAQCSPDPLFEPLKVTTMKAKLKRLQVMPTGAKEAKAYEELAADLLMSLLYPELEFAKAQSRTVSGAHIRDLVFYNDGKTPFLHDLRENYDARQPVVEFKNVGKLEPDHVDQLYRYLSPNFGRLGFLLSRNAPPPNVVRNIIDLHSAHRYAVICLDDADLALMVKLMETPGRRPVDVLKKKFVEFGRALPT
jgi:hypothetical protein